MTMRRFLLFSVCCTGITVGVVAAQPGDALAVVAGRAIGARDFSRVLMRMRGSDYATTLKTLTPDGRRLILEDMVGTRVLAQAARESGLDQQPDVAFDIEQAVGAVLAAQYRERLRAQLAPSDGEMREWYDAHRNELATVPRVKARHILVVTPDEAAAARAALEAGTSFDDVARMRSIDTQTRGAGGELGWIPKGFMTAAFDAVLFTLRPGQVSEPIQTSLGYHIVRVDEFDERTIPPFEAARDQVRDRLTEARIDAARADLAKKYGARIDADALDRFGRPQGRH